MGKPATIKGVAATVVFISGNNNTIFISASIKNGRDDDRRCRSRARESIESFDFRAPFPVRAIESLRTRERSPQDQRSTSSYNAIQ